MPYRLDFMQRRIRTVIHNPCPKTRIREKVNAVGPEARDHPVRKVCAAAGNPVRR